MPHPAHSGLGLFSNGSWPEARRIGDILRTETVGGALLVVTALVALLWANSPWRQLYFDIAGTQLGPAFLHLDLTIAQWAADGLLAIFFFVAGLELKQEFITGDLRDPRRASLPVAAAVGGMIVPALIFVGVNLGRPDALNGWAIPTATDIAFALAVLAVIGRKLPAALRTFLLTLAVVDDLLAITIIALFYTQDLEPLPLALAALPLIAFAVLVQRGRRSALLLLPLAILTWVLVHESGVHATVAGVLLAFSVPVTAQGAGRDVNLASHLEHRWRPLSTGIAVPVFAFFAAGVSIADAGGIGAALRNEVTLGIIAGLVLGKAIGVMAATYLVQRFTHARLADELSWWDVLGLSLLAGIGFTVSLLIGELAFGAGTPTDGYVKIGVLTGSLLATLLAAIILRLRNRAYSQLNAGDQRDQDGDDLPDIYQQES